MQLKNKWTLSSLWFSLSIQVWSMLLFHWLILALVFSLFTLADKAHVGILGAQYFLYNLSLITFKVFGTNMLPCWVAIEFTITVKQLVLVISVHMLMNFDVVYIVLALGRNRTHVPFPCILCDESWDFSMFTIISNQREPPISVSKRVAIDPWVIPHICLFPSNNFSVYDPFTPLPRIKKHLPSKWSIVGECSKWKFCIFTIFIIHPLSPQGFTMYEFPDHFYSHRRANVL